MRSIIAFTVAAMSLVVGAMFLYYRDGGTLVAAQDDTVGEMLLDEGLRFEAADSTVEAILKFMDAESARFQGEKNWRHLQLKHGQDKRYTTDRLKFFRLAATGYELAKVKPSLWREAWVGSCELLAEQRKWEELAKAVEEWSNAVEAAGPRGIYQTSQDQNLDLSERLRFRARLAVHQGNQEEAKRLLQLSWNDDAVVMWGRLISIDDFENSVLPTVAFASSPNLIPLFGAI